MKKILLTAFTLLFSTLVSARAEDLDFSIRFYNKKIYYPGQPVQLQITLKNRESSTEDLSFKAAQDRVYNLRFTVQNQEETGRPLTTNEIYNQRFFNGKPQFFRDIILRPGEEYSFNVNLQEFITLDRPGLYTVDAEFFPKLQGDATTPRLRSNTLPLLIRPGTVGIQAYTDNVNAETGAALMAEPIAPDEVILRTIQARIAKERTKFFLYMDIEAIMRRDPEMDADWRRSTVERRIQMVQEFQQRLWDSPLEFRVPNEYSILKTEYNGSAPNLQPTGKVVVQMKYDEGAFFQKKEYTYLLKKIENVWKIVDYTVRNLERETKSRMGFR